MPSAALTTTLHVPEALWANLVFAWPTAPSSARPDLALFAPGPSAYLGPPFQFVYPTSLAPLASAASGFSVAATAIATANPPGASQFVLFSTLDTNNRGGVDLEVDSGTIGAFWVDAVGGNVGNVASWATATGSAMRLVATYSTSPAYSALFCNGALVASQAAVSSWTVQNTLTLGGRSAFPTTSVASCILQDVYLFDRALTAVEVRQLFEVLP